MPLLVPTLGENRLLENALGKNASEDVILKLFVNNITPADGDTPSTFTEMSTHGYAAKTLTKTSWTVAQSGGVAEGTYAEQVWTFSAAAAVTVYGYYMVGASSSILVWEEKFASGKVIQNSGDQIKITPKITLSKV
ncbi:MAG: hypothetical protein ACREXW_00945 [Gammaproteobacteria bacterium]